MDPIKVFRVCVLGTLVSYLAFLGVASLPEPNEDWRVLLGWNFNGSLFYTLNPQESRTLDSILVAVFLSIPAGVYFIVNIGLFFFNRLARLANLYLMVFFILQAAVTGIAVYRPYESAIGFISTLLSGAVLAMSFLPPVSQLFSKPVLQSPRIEI